jgi:osmotically-inducible protein OsmY
MTTVTPSPINTQVRDAVLQQLEWDTSIDARAVGVTAQGGVVSLTGFIDTYAGKLAAERAAKRVRGVRAVANDIQVRPRLERTDPEIAADVAAALGARPEIPEAVQAVVHGGHVTLTGAAPSYFLRALAAEALHHVRGVKEVTNYVRVEPAASERDLRRRIVQALHRSAEVDARGVTIIVEGTEVRLEGEVASWSEVEAAEHAVMHAPGITVVNNCLTVSPHSVPLPPPDFEIC